MKLQSDDFHGICLPQESQQSTAESTGRSQLMGTHGQQQHAEWARILSAKKLYLVVNPYLRLVHSSIGDDILHMLTGNVCHVRGLMCQCWTLGPLKRYSSNTGTRNACTTRLIDTSSK